MVGTRPRMIRSEPAAGDPILVHGAFPPFELREGVLVESAQLPRGDINAQLPRGDINYVVRSADDRVIRVDASRVHAAGSGERANCRFCRAASGTDPTAPSV